MPGALASELEAWGNDDLIDLDADEADWSKPVGTRLFGAQWSHCTFSDAFEEAPASNLPVNAVALGFEDVGPADG